MFRIVSKERTVPNRRESVKTLQAAVEKAKVSQRYWEFRKGVPTKGLNIQIEKRR